MTDDEKRWKRIGRIMGQCLGTRGYEFTEDNIEELIQIYEDCQEWSDDGKMLTGDSYDEIEDFVKHSSCIDEVLDK